MSTHLIPPRGSLRYAAVVRAISAKRILDIVLALAALIVLSPLFLVIAAVVALDGGPVLFGHLRVGLHGHQFRCLKFRTMIVGAEGCLNEYLALHPAAAAEWRLNQKIDFDPRITGVGRLLRKTSLDELPQLINVLRGDMSLVGPRPVTLAEVQHRYGARAAVYMAVRPGITGLWQVSGRNQLSYDERVALDATYVRTQSLARDVAILLRTVKVLLNGDGK